MQKLSIQALLIRVKDLLCDSELICSQTAQEIDQLLAFCLLQRRKESILNVLQLGPERRESRRPGFRHFDDVRPSVVRIAYTANPPAIFERVEKQNHRRLIDERQFAEAPLVHGTGVGQRSKDAEMARMKTAAFDCGPDLFPQPRPRNVQKKSDARQRR
jgi:hypothetical protein